MLVFPSPSDSCEKESYFKYFIVGLKNLPVKCKSWLIEEQTNHFFTRTKINLGEI